MPQQNIALNPGTHLNKYTINHCISSGGFSIVYLAFTETRFPVVIKEFMPSSLKLRTGQNGNTVFFQSAEDEKKFQSGLLSFFKESESIARLNSPHIVGILDVFLMNNTAYMVMPFELGTTLQTVILKFHHLVDDAWLQKISLDIAKGIEEFHSHDILHLDIKPSNILIRPDSTAMLIDFGSCRIGKGKKHLPPMHTPGFAAPEQYLSDFTKFPIGPWTDLYNFGATIYSCIEQQPPDHADIRVEQQKTKKETNYSLNRFGQYHSNILSLIEDLLVLDPPSRVQNIQDVISRIRHYSPLKEKNTFFLF